MNLGTIQAIFILYVLGWPKSLFRFSVTSYGKSPMIFFTNPIRLCTYNYIQVELYTYIYMEKEMATHSSVLAWRIPGMGESDGLPSMGSYRVGHD